MIRMALFAMGFMAITIALLVYQPGSGRNMASPMDQNRVTREEPALVPIPTRAAEPVQQAYVPAAPRVDKPQQAQAAPQTQAQLDDQSMRRMTWETLSGLNQATGKEAAPGQPGSLLHTIVRRSLGDTPTAPANPVWTQKAAAATLPTSYVVQPGDSLVSIAGKIYGDVNMTGPLFAANQAILARPDDLKPGQTLFLPPM